jgi:DNA-binding NarL/FixJ family response regulator
MNRALILSESEFAKQGLYKIVKAKLKKVNTINDYSLQQDSTLFADTDLVILHTHNVNNLLFEVIEKIKACSTNLKVIVITAEDHTVVDIECSFIQHGVSGLLSEKEAIENLALAIHSISGGNLYFSDAAKNLALKSISLSKTSSPKKMSKRELEIFKLLRCGYTAKEIGYKFGITEQTVNVHKANIKIKFNLHSSKNFFQFLQNYIPPSS